MGLSSDFCLLKNCKYSTELLKNFKLTTFLKDIGLQSHISYFKRMALWFTNVKRTISKSQLHEFY